MSQHTTAGAGRPRKLGVESGEKWKGSGFSADGLALGSH
jgi:hypothetical protein